MLAFIPYSVDVPNEQTPYANWLLIAVTVAIFFCIPMEELEEGGKYFHLLSHGWQFPGMLTHLFLHADIFHLAGNMLFLWVFGNAICGKLGNSLYIPFYLILGMAANAFETILGDIRPGLGASGAINAIVGMYLFMFPLNEISCTMVILYRFIFFAASSYWIILYWLAFDIFGLLFDRGSSTGYAAHIGGFIAGFALCLLLVKGKWLKPASYELFLPDAIKGRRSGKKDKILPEYREMLNEIRYGIKAHREDDQQDEPATGPTSQKSSPADRLANIREQAAFSVKNGHIVFSCDCGKKLRVPVSLGGKQGRCPDCQELVEIPKLKTVAE